MLIGCGLGGGSLINAAVGLRPDARVFADAAWPDEVRRMGSSIRASPGRGPCCGRPATRKPPTSSNIARSKRQAAAFGQEPVAAPVVVSFEATLNPAGVEQPACTLCGDCCSGCNVGAKNTVALTYLPDAKAHGAEIFTELTVSHVEKVDRHWRVHFAPTEEPDAPMRSVEAKTVVLSAGTLGSTEILLRSREVGLPVSDSLGQRFSANGDIIAFALGGEQRVNGIGVGHPPKFVGDAIGACVTGEIELHDAWPPRPLDVHPGGRAAVGARAASAGVLRLGGQAARRRPKPDQGRLSWPARRAFYTFFVVSHDEAKGRIRLENGRRADRLAERRRAAGLCPASMPP